MSLKAECIIVCLLLSVAKLSTAQNCCTATQQFAMLTTDNRFNETHHNPLPIINFIPTGVDVYFKTVSQKGHAYLLKAKKKTNKYVFVFHEWWGLNDYIKREAQHLQSDLGNVNILVIDLYDGRIANTADSAQAYVRLTTDKRCRHIIEGALKYVGKKAQIATLGWCFGGSWSMQAAIMSGTKAKACIIYYGMPESNTAKLKNICPTLGIFANNDDWISPKVVDKFETIMKQVNKTLVVHRYYAQHAFANPSNPNYDVNATNDAYTHAIAFIRKMLLQVQTP
jgi:carboxymethylenebutenolidase